MSHEIHDYASAEFAELVRAVRSTQTLEVRCSILLRHMKAHAERLCPWSAGRFDELFLHQLSNPPFAKAGGKPASAGWKRRRTTRNEISGALKGLYVGTACAVEAIRTYREGKIEEAWHFAFDAAQWEGFLSGMTEAGESENAAEAVESFANEPWVLHEPQRDDVLSGVLYRTLKAAKDAGDRKPTTRNIFTQWHHKMPSELHVVQTSEVSFVDRSDEMKTVNFAGIKDRIKRMTDPKRGR